MANGNPTQGPADTTIVVNDTLPPDFKSETLQRATALRDSGLIERFWAAGQAFLLQIPVAVIDFWAANMKPLMLRFIPALTQITDATADESAELTAIVVRDVLAANIPLSTIRGLFEQGKEEEAFAIIGKTIYDDITRKLISGQSLSPAQGEDSAHRFLGYVTNYRIKEGIQAFVLDVIGWQWLDSYDAIADDLFRALSLERHSRAALRPMFDTIIATPLEWQMNKRYRPKMLGTGEAVRAHLRGGLSDSELREIMARQGYSDKDIGHLIAAIELPWSETQLLKLVHYGHFTQDTAIDLMREKGYSAQRAIDIFTALEIGPADSLIDQRKRLWLNAYLDGHVHQGEFENAIDQMPMGDREKQAWKDLAAISRVIPRKKLSLSQMREAFLHGTIDLAEWNQFLRDEGYNPRDAQILTLELLLDLKEETKELSLSQIIKSFIEDVIDEAAFTKLLADLPYSSAARAVILAQARKDKADAQPKPKP